MAKITVGSTVRYVGEQKPELAGVEGVVTDINAANRTAHVFWAHGMSAIRQGRPQHDPTWEAAQDLKPIRAFTKDFRQGSLHSARGKMKSNAKSKKRNVVDFDDEQAVLEEVAKSLKEDPDDFEIDTDSGLEGFGEGTVYRIEQGRVEYVVVEDTDQMYALALAVVKQDLEEEPEIFEQSFLEGHIDKDKLRRELEPDELNSRIDDITYEAELRPEEFWEEYEREGFEAPEEDEDGERREPDSDEIEELAEKQVKDRLEDPMQYLEDIYGDEAVSKAMEIAGFDIDAAAEEAVETDGPEHFLARYDGNYYETPSGFVYWRDN